MSRGPAPKPTALKKLAGTRADRVNPAEPQPPAGRPEAPAHLDDVARGEWGRMVEILDRMGVLTTADGAALALYCTHYSRWLKAENVARKNILICTPGGVVRPNPALVIAQQAMAAMQRLLAEFGCTPASRSRIALPEGPAPVDKLTELLNRRKPAATS